MAANINATTKTTDSFLTYLAPLPPTLNNRQQEKVAALLESPLKRHAEEDLQNPSKHQKITSKETSPLIITRKRSAEIPLQNLTKHQKTDSNPFSLNLGNASFDICFEVFKKLNPEAFMTCRLVSSHWNKAIKSTCLNLTPIDLIIICPKLTIIDSELIKKKCNFEIPNEPSINYFEVIKSVRDLTCYVTNDEGLTLLTVPPEDDIADFVSRLSDTKFHTNLTDSPNDTANQSTLNKTHRKVMTNNILKDSKNTDCSQKRYRLNKHRCTMPTSNDYVFLCSLSYKIFGKLLYRAEEGYQGQSSTKIYNGRCLSNVIVGFFIEQDKPCLKTLVNIRSHRDRAGTGALRTLSNTPQA